jgi:hypothetical protein
VCVGGGGGGVKRGEVQKKKKPVKVSKMGPDVLFNKKESYGTEKNLI